MSGQVLRVISLGAGVQSTTMALMAAHGLIRPPDVAIFADTQWEPRATYDHLRWLSSPNVLPFPVHVVTKGNLRQSIIDRRNTTGGRFAAIPWFTRNPDGSPGMGRRQCTKEYKLEPIIREVRRLLGKPGNASIAAGAVEVMIGISTDEAHRMKPARQRYITNAWPLIELRMSRSDCLAWLERNGYPRPPKSACIGCPYTSNERWRERKEKEPEEFADAVFIDQQLREGDARGMRVEEFVHRSLVPLDQVQFDVEGQADLFGHECEGMCGV